MLCLLCTVSFADFAPVCRPQYQGLIHISSLTVEKMEPAEVSAFVEEQVGPVGSRVRVLVKSLSYKKAKRISLELIETMPKQDLDDLVFARPPR